MARLCDTVTYKYIGALELELNVYRTEHSKNAPILLYLHGNGSPVKGSRWDIPKHLLDGVSRFNYALVSADYRLAPQVGIQEIYIDVEDCINFLRKLLGLAASLPRGTIDRHRVAVAGSGGGGYLALLAGLHVVPKPRAVLALDPITDPLGSFFTTKHLWGTVYHGDMGKNAVVSFLQQFLAPNGAVKTHYVHDASDEQYPTREPIYTYMLHCGNLAKMLRFNVGAGAESNPANDQWRVAKALRTCELPPTFIMHGSADDQVDVGQSDQVVGALMGALGLERFNEYNQYERAQGWGHASDDESGQYMDRTYEFLQSWI